MNIEQVLLHQKWAVVGVTAKEEKFGFKVFDCLRRHGYEVYPIHPSLTSIQNVICYRSISSIPKKPDVVVLIVREEIGLGVLSECAKIGCKLVWLQPGADTESILAYARELGIEVIRDCVLRRLEDKK